MKTEGEPDTIIRSFGFIQAVYPDRLKNIYNPPEMLHVIGRLPDENRHSAAIVGARNATPYGRKLAEQFASVLAQNGIQIISGMARGIDTAGHWGALKAGGDTFAVLGCGVDVCYPAENRKLYEEIAKKGGIISEQWIGAPPVAKYFPMRNRIICGLADIILVVEARERSGALITADIALEQGKDVFAIPGRPEDEMSRGCNNLIKQGAGLVCQPEDLFDVLNLSLDSRKCSKQKNKIILATDEKTVYSCISLQPKHIDEIQKETGKSAQELIPLLLSMELKNAICEVTRNYYVRL